MNDRVTVPRRIHSSWHLWLIVLTAFGLRVYGLSAQSLWYDEAFSVAVVRADLPDAIRLLLSDLHPPLYYLILRAGIAAFGSSEFAVRFVSVIPGVIMVPLAWTLARRLFDRWTGWLAAALVCFSPLFVWYAREARMYSQATALGLAATWALVRAQDTGRARWWAAFAACALGAVYSHYSALYLVATLGLIWLAMTIHISNSMLALYWRALKPGLAAFGAVAAGLAAAALHLSLSQTSHAYWPGRLDVIPALVNGVRVMISGQTSVPGVSDALTILCGVLALTAMLHGVTSPARRRGLWLIALIPLVGMTLTFLVLYQQPKFEPRHLIAFVPAIWLLVAAGVRALWESRVTKAATVLAILAVAGGLIVSDVGVFTGAVPRDDWRGMVTYVRQNIRPDEILILVSGHAYPALAYYDAPPWIALPDDPVLDVTHVLDYKSVTPVLNRVRAQQRGVWLALWQDEIVDPTHIVPALLSEIGSEVPVAEQFDGLRLRHFVFDLPYAPFSLDPPMAHRLDSSPLPGLTALGFTIAPQPLPADKPLSVQVFWRADAPKSGAAGGSLRIEDEQGQEWARHDDLLAGSFLSERWPPGETVMGQYSITLPVGTPPGTYRLRQIVYRADKTGMLDLGTLVVTRPLSSLAGGAAALGVDTAGLARLGDLTLLSAGLDQQTVKPCDDLYFTLMWRDERPPSDDYAVRVTLAGQAEDGPLAPGLPTLQWQPGDVWRTRHHIEVSCRARDSTAELLMTVINSVGQPVAAPVKIGMVHVNAGRMFAPPVMQHPFYADLGSVRLLGYDLASTRLRAGQPFQLTLYWQATREMTTSLTVFTHVEGERLWGQHDGPPGMGLKPTETWLAGEVVADRHQIELDPATPLGRYRLTVGMYDPTSQVRVAAFDESGNRWPDDVIFLQDIAVAAR